MNRPPLPNRRLLLPIRRCLAPAALALPLAVLSALPLAAARPSPSPSPAPSLSSCSVELNLDPDSPVSANLDASCDFRWLSAALRLAVSPDAATKLGAALLCPYAALGSLETPGAVSRLLDPLSGSPFTVLEAPSTSFRPDSSFPWTFGPESSGPSLPFPDIGLRTGALCSTPADRREAWALFLGTAHPAPFAFGLTVAGPISGERGEVEADASFLANAVDERDADSWLDPGRSRLLPGDAIARCGLGVRLARDPWRGGLRLDAAFPDRFYPALALHGGLALDLDFIEFEVAYRRLLGHAEPSADPFFPDGDGEPCGSCEWAEAGIREAWGARASLKPVRSVCIDFSAVRTVGRTSYAPASIEASKTAAPSRTEYGVSATFDRALLKSKKSELRLRTRVAFDRRVTWLLNGSMEAENGTEADIKLGLTRKGFSIDVIAEADLSFPETGSGAEGARLLLPGSLYPLDPKRAFKAGIDAEIGRLLISARAGMASENGAEALSASASIGLRLPGDLGELKAARDDAGVLSLRYSWKRGR